MTSEDSNWQEDCWDDELDVLMRQALREEVGRREPSPQVWECIRTSLEGGPVAFPKDRYSSLRLGYWGRVAGAMVGCLLVTSLLVGTLVTPQRSPAANEAPVVISQADFLSPHGVWNSQREQFMIQGGLLPGDDPLLVYRRGYAG